MAFSLWPFWKPELRCARCGLAVKREGDRRFRVDADVWSRKCKALAEGASRPATPFECPNLKAALHPPHKEEPPEH